MISDRTPSETLFLWRLVSCGGGCFQSNMKPAPAVSLRATLERVGLIRVEKRRKTQAGRRPTTANYIFLTDLGWQWAGEHLDAPLVASKAASPVLQAMMARLKIDLERNHRSLADFILKTEPTPVIEPTSEFSVVDRVRATYRELTGGRSISRVRLADLRSRLRDVPRDLLDRALLQMERDEVLVCLKLDNPQEIDRTDEQAALLNSAGHQRHVIYMES